MIILRIGTAGGSHELRMSQPSITLGSARGVDVRRTDAGWPALAGTLMVRGTRVVLRVPGPVGEVELAPGEPLLLGEATLVCMEAPSTGARPSPAPARTRAAAPGRARTPATPSPARTPAPGEGPAQPAGTPPGAAATTRAAAPRALPVASPVRRRPVLDQRDFDEEVLDQLKRMPWMVASVALHVLVFLAFWMVAPLVERDVGGGAGHVQGALVVPEEHAGSVPEPEPEPPPVPDEAPPELQPEPTVEREPRLPSEAPEAVELELGPMLSEEESPPDLGEAPGVSAARARSTPRGPPKAVSPALQPTTPVDKGSADAQRRQVAEHLRERLGIGRGGQGHSLSHLVADDVLVVQGEYDHQEHVLRDLQIPFRTVGHYEARFVSGEALRRPRFVFWNCGNDPPRRILERIRPPLRAFVERGGYLFTSDWVIAHALGHAFEEYVGTHGTAAGLPELVIDIRPASGQGDHPLLEGVFHPGVQGRWWLESKSVDCVVKKPAAVDVLIEGPELKSRHGLSSAVAVTFTHGKGRVLHVVGHYDQEMGNLAGVVAVQRLALNFLLMSLRERPLR